MSLISGVPVSAISSGRRGAGPDPLGELEHVLGALGLLVLDEVRLVDDHRAEAEVAEPADVPVEDLVVDDHDVGEAVDVVAVAVDHGDRAVRGPDADLAGPVGLDDVGDDGQQRVGVRGLRGEQRLGGLAEAGLVGEQVGAVAVGGGLDHLRLVVHQRERAGHADVAGLGQRHARGRAAAVLEGAEQRAEELPGGQPARLGAALVGGGEVGDEERVGQLALDDRVRDDPALGTASSSASSGSGSSSSSSSMPAAAIISRRSSLAESETRGVLGEQREQGGVAGGGLGQDRGHAVEPLELVGLLGLGELGVGLDAGPLLADQQRDDLELGARGR